MSRRHARGAATTEFALAMLLIIPCVLYGVYAGELFVVGAKAQEAEISAAYDMTGYRYHDYQSPAAALSSTVPSRYDSVATGVSADVDADLKDLNSFSATGRTGVTLVAGKAQFTGSAVTCTKRPLATAGGGGGYLKASEVMPFDTLDFPVDPNFSAAGPAANDVRATLTRDWIITCSSRLKHTSQWIPHYWNQEMTSHNDALTPVSAGGVNFGGLGDSLNGLSTNGSPSFGMAMLTDDWAVEQPNVVAADEIALKDTGGSNGPMYRVVDRLHNMFWPGLGNQQLDEDLTFLIGHAFPFGESTSTGQVDALRLALDTRFNRLTNLQLETGIPCRYPNLNGSGECGNKPWYLLPHQDAEKSYAALDAVAAVRSSGHYLGHPNASFNQP
jgi:hypothetical protein